MKTSFKNAVKFSQKSTLDFELTSQGIFVWGFLTRDFWPGVYVCGFMS